MEGIRDGRAVDDCVHCVFIAPSADACPKCAKRMRYVPATMDSADERHDAIDAFRRGVRDLELLERLWRLGLRPDDDELIA